MKRVSNVINFGWRRRYSMTVALALVATCLFFVANALGDAGNPILGTIKGTLVTHADGTVTVYVRGQWNWLSHGSDCNFDRAATGVGIIWNDLNGPGTTAGINEVEQVALTGTVTGGTFKLKFGGQTTAAIAYNATATQMQQALAALSSIGTGNVSVTTGSPTWRVEFVGALGKKDVTAIQLASKSLTGSGANVAITTLTNGQAAVFNGYLVSNGAIAGYVGTKDATSLNPQDRMVHPVDRGNQVEGYTTAGTDYPAAQQFVDPSPPGVTAAEVAAWRGGCGREPITATASKNAPGGGPNGEATGLSCATGTTTCAGHPWGSWGYEKNGGLGYSHTYRSRSDVTTVCANFYDVHGGGASGNANFQIANGTKEITVDANGDNSIDTNAFDISQGANCISFPLAHPKISTTASGPITIGEGSIHDTATLSDGSSPTGSITFKAYGPQADPNNPVCTGTPAFTSAAITVNGNGDYGSGDFTPTTAGTYVWIASYSGDANNEPVASLCTDVNEKSVVNRHPSAVPTGQKLQVTDYAKVTPSSGTATGTVTFQLFTSSDCTTGKIYDSGPVTLDANGRANTDQAGTQPPTINADGTYSWLVTYNGNFGSATSSCGTEKISTSGNTPGVDP